MNFYKELLWCENLKGCLRMAVQKEPIDVYEALKILCKDKKEIVRWNPDEDKKEQGEIRSNILIEKQNYKPKGVGMTGVEIQTQK